MSQRAPNAGFTLLEMMVTLVIFSIVAGLGGVALQNWVSNQRVSSAARDVADLLLLARQEAIRTSTPHLVFFDRLPGGGGLQDASGGGVAALAARDDNNDGLPQTAEYVASIPFATNGVGWGSVFALQTGSETPAPDDNPAATYPLSSPCCSFTQPGGSPARWIVFLPDGIPRAFSTGPLNVGDIGSGPGSVYVTSGDRDYAVVLAALGGVRVHAYNDGVGAWRQ